MDRELYCDGIKSNLTVFIKSPVLQKFFLLSIVDIIHNKTLTIVMTLSLLNKNYASKYITQFALIIKYNCILPYLALKRGMGFSFPYSYLPFYSFQ